MKVFISADIEGVSITNNSQETSPGKYFYDKACEMMTREVSAVATGALKAGATKVVVKDAHGPAMNIDPAKLPKNVDLIRGWSGHPYRMVEGLDSSFDAAFFVGYHQGASLEGNSLSHTINSSKIAKLTINDRIASEFYIFSLVAAMEKVPTVFLSGDKALLENEKDLHPNLITVPTKEGLGARTLVYNPINTLENLENEAKFALENKTTEIISLPEKFVVDLEYKWHIEADEYSYFPGVERISGNTLRFVSNDYFEVLRTLKFLI